MTSTSIVELSFDFSILGGSLSGAPPHHDCYRSCCHYSSCSRIVPTSTGYFQSCLLSFKVCSWASICWHRSLRDYCQPCWLEHSLFAQSWLWRRKHSRWLLLHRLTTGRGFSVVPTILPLCRRVVHNFRVLLSYIQCLRRHLPVQPRPDLSRGYSLNLTN